MATDNQPPTRCFAKCFKPLFDSLKPAENVQAFRDALPLHVQVSTKIWRLPSFVHFLDVCDGFESLAVRALRYRDQHYNSFEVNVVDALVRSFLQNEVSPQSISVMATSKSQQVKLRAAAKSNDWVNIAAIATLATQEAWRNAKVVIISLVATMDLPELMSYLDYMLFSCGHLLSCTALYFVGKADFWLSDEQALRNQGLHDRFASFMIPCEKSHPLSFTSNSTTPSLRSPSPMSLLSITALPTPSLTISAPERGTRLQTAAPQSTTNNSDLCQPLAHVASSAKAKAAEGIFETSEVLDSVPKTQASVFVGHFESKSREMKDQMKQSKELRDSKRKRLEDDLEKKLDAEVDCRLRSIREGMEEKQKQLEEKQNRLDMEMENKLEILRKDMEKRRAQLEAEVDIEMKVVELDT